MTASYVAVFVQLKLFEKMKRRVRMKLEKI